MGIAICLAIIPPAEFTSYKNLFDSIVGKANVCKHGSNDLVDNAALRQDSADLSLVAKKLKHLHLVMAVLIQYPLSAQ
jgi:hypothetical protein